MQIRTHHTLTVFTSSHQVKNSGISKSSITLEKANPSSLHFFLSNKPDFFLISKILLLFKLNTESRATKFLNVCPHASIFVNRRIYRLTSHFSQVLNNRGLIYEAPFICRFSSINTHIL